MTLTGLNACPGITVTNYMQIANILPDPFPISLYRKSTMDSFEQKYTTDVYGQGAVYNDFDSCSKDDDE